MYPYLLFAAGVCLAAIGGEYFVRGIIAMAKRWRLPAGMIAGTLAAAATSAPEFAVSTIAAWDGTPQIGLGDALGSNVVNIGLVLGLLVSLTGLRIDRREIFRVLPFLIAAPATTGALILDGDISRFDALVLLCLFAVWLFAQFKAAREHQKASQDEHGQPDSAARMATHVTLGLGALIVAGRLIVAASQELVLMWNLTGYFIGASLVALGTSVPELATALTARFRGYQDISLGTVFGSNIFNGTFIIGIAALIHPIRLGAGEVAITLLAGLALVLLCIPGADGALTRRRGFLLIACYTVYLAALASGPLDPGRIG